MRGCSRRCSPERSKHGPRTWISQVHADQVRATCGHGLSVETASTQECQPMFDGMDMYSRGYRFPPWFISRCVRLSRTSVLTGFQVYILQGCRDTWNRICVAAKCIPSSQALAVVYNTHSINGPRHEPSPRYCRVESNHDEQAWYFSTEKVGKGRRMHNPFTTHCRTPKIVPCAPRTGD